MKRFLGLLILPFLVATLQGTAGAQAATGEPVRIGFLTVLTGTAAESGRDMLEGLQLYLEEIGYEMAGRRVELIVEDTGGVPATTLSKTRKLVEQDGVDVLVGPFLANEGYAITSYVAQQEVPWVVPVTSADDLTQREFNPFAIRMGWTSSQVVHPLGEYVYHELGYRRIAAVGSDYAFSYEVLGGFQRTFEALGGQVVQKIWTPFGTTDFAAYISRIRRDVDAVFVTMTGADVVRFMSQYHEFGMNQVLPVVGGPLMADESLLRSMGDEALGLITSHFWSADLDRAEARSFVERYRARYGKIPSYYAESCYDAGMWIHRAVEAVGADLRDRSAFLDALRNVTLEEAPRGPIRLDSFQNAVQNVYIRRVVKRDGILWNEVLRTIPEVSQFWTWGSDEYLQEPLYTRDYPPCRFCGQ